VPCRLGFVVRLAVSYVALVLAAGFVLGTARVLWLVPRVGTRAAELLEMPLMLVATVLAARWVDRRLPAGTRSRTRLGIGAIALGLLLAAELLVVAPLRGLSPLEALADRDPVSGTAYWLSLALFLLMPWLLRRRVRTPGPGSR
jgi:hypothetical protein